MVLSNKSQYILSKIGIPLFEDKSKLSTKEERTIHYYQKDAILTLHLISVDEYPEKEKNLLEAIIGSIKGNSSDAIAGKYAFLEGENINFEQITAENQSIKAILVFFDAMLITSNRKFVESPPLENMLARSTLKQNLWAQIKPFTEN